VASEPSAPEPTPEPAPPKKAWNLEEALGRQVFLWAGVVAVTVGVAFFLYLAAQQMGAAGKVVIGFAGGAALLGAGFFAERREGYRVFGRPLLAGGCAIIYFVTFAMHFIPAAKLVDSEIVDTEVSRLARVRGPTIGRGRFVVPTGHATDGERQNHTELPFQSTHEKPPRQKEKSSRSPSHRKRH